MRTLIPILAALIAGSVPDVATAQAPKTPKNVVIVIADDLGMQLGCYGDKVIRSPNLDALARRGVRFARAYASVSSCSPSRASILTGLYTHQNGQYGLQHIPHNQQTFAWVQSLPNLLRAAGYWTGIIGKVHIGPQAVYNFHAQITKDLGGNRDVAAMARAARDFVDQREKRPFFLVYAFADPHRAKEGFGNQAFAKEPMEVRYDPKDVPVPVHLPDQPEVRQDLAEYYQSITRMDCGVGLLLDALRTAGVLDDTLIIFLSDNGMPFPGAKTTLYDAGIHLPLMIAGPGVPESRTNDALVSFVDIAPTVLDFAGAKGAKYKLPGRSLRPILTNDHPEGWDTVYASHQFHEITMYYPMRMVMTRRSKLIVNLAPERDFPLAADLWGSPTWQGLRKRGDKLSGQLRLDSFLRRPAEEFFDLAKDPHELNNLTRNGEVKELVDLRVRLRAWQRQTNDPWLILDRERDPQLNR